MQEKNEVLYYTQSAKEVLSKFNTDPSRGLSEEEVLKRLEQYGENSLKEAEKIPLYEKIIEQFKDVMVIILIIAALLSGILGDMVEAVIIIAIVIVNAILGVYQEGKAEESVAALQKMSAPEARVLRDGNQQMVDAARLVPGDIVILEAGDIIPADCRILEGTNMKAEEAALTGESVPVEKNADFISDKSLGIGDRHNMLFSSTALTYGRGRAVVCTTGEATEMGKIALRISSMVSELTPLQISMNSLGKFLAIFCIAVVAITFVVGMIEGGDPFDLFMTSVSLAVAAIPEGLTAVITIVLSLGMNRMAKKNAIVKKLLAVETLGSVNVICTDKTGTLTQNEMTVVKIFADSVVYDVSGTGYSPEGEISSTSGVKDESALNRLLQIGVLCNEAKLIRREDNSWQILGDPTEGAMLTVGAKKNFNSEELLKKFPRLGDLPFDSERKMMSVFHAEFPEGKLSLTKGAPDIVLNRCTSILTSGGVRKLTDSDRANILKENSSFATSALRVLAFAYKIHQGEGFDDAENEMIFVGLMGMIDPPRTEARDAISVCKKAGIRAVMITGDYQDTAVAIAKDLGLMREGDGVLSGGELEKMSKQDLENAVGSTAVYARVSPEHKVKIVEALQAKGNIASMTGDGVNDAPALKRADIGVAMGITGTEVAKGASDMILTDDNFSTIVSAVSEGRVIYSNIRKFVNFLLSCNVAEIFIIFLTMLFLGPNMIPLMPIQLLWLNLVTDSFPALALGQEAGEPDIMNYPPRKKTDRIMDSYMICSVLVRSVAIFISVYVAFLVGISRYGIRDSELESKNHERQFIYVEDAKGKDLENVDNFELRYADERDLIDVRSGEILKQSDNYGGMKTAPSYGAMTYAFVALILIELIKAYSARSEHVSPFKLGLFSNSVLNKATLACIALTLIVIYVPALDVIFNTVPFGFRDWAVILPLSIIPFIVGEVFKAIYYHAVTIKKSLVQ